MDVGRLRTGELIAGISGLALLVILFLNWYGIPDVDNGVNIEGLRGFAEAGGADTSFNAWQSFDFIDIILLLTSIVAVGLAVATASARTVALPVAASAVTAGLGIIATLLVLYRVIDPPEDAAREYGVFLGLAAAAGVAVGGWLSMQEEGTTFTGAVDEARARGSGAGPAAPPPSSPPPAPRP
jgi:hypothetical protein